MFEHARTTGFLLLIALLLLVGGCDKPPHSEAEMRGEVKDGVFRSSVVDMELDLPDEWHLATRTQINTMMNVALGPEAATPEIVMMLAMFRHPFGAPVPINANFNLTLEYLGRRKPDTLNDYMVAARKQLDDDGAMQVTWGQIGSSTIDGVTFITQDSSVQMLNLQFRQRLMAAFRGDYVLCIALTYIDDDELQFMQELIESMRFDTE